MPKYLGYSDSTCKTWGVTVLPRSIAGSSRAPVLAENLVRKLLVLPSLPVCGEASGINLERLGGYVDYQLE